MPKRSSSSVTTVPEESPSGAPSSASAPAPPQPAARISAIGYSLGTDHSFSTSATYRYPDGTMRPATVRLDPHRYDLLQAAIASQMTPDAGPGEVATALHEVYYCLYAPRPKQAPPTPQMGTVPDRT